MILLSPSHSPLSLSSVNLSIPLLNSTPTTGAFSSSSMVISDRKLGVRILRLVLAGSGKLGSTGGELRKSTGGVGISGDNWKRRQRQERQWDSGLMDSGLGSRRPQNSTEVGWTKNELGSLSPDRVPGSPISAMDGQRRIFQRGGVEGSAANFIVSDDDWISMAAMDGTEKGLNEVLRVRSSAIQALMM
ncbi:hypothetical protein OROMI_006644 [Orobanche minor]